MAYSQYSGGFEEEQYGYNDQFQQPGHQMIARPQVHYLKILAQET